VSLVPSRTDSGLHVLTQGADEAAVYRALRDYDNDLRLVPQDSDAYGQRVYKVYRYAGSDRPAEFLFMWGDDLGNPFPLSMQLVERARHFDKNSRNRDYVDPDEHNRRLKEQRHKDADADAETIKDEMLKRHGRSPAFRRSPAFAASRREARRKGRSYG
jgi:hypothetical protein